MDERTTLINAIEKSAKNMDVDYIICEDMLGFNEYEDELRGKEYVIQRFGGFYVAFIFR